MSEERWTIRTYRAGRVGEKVKFLVDENGITTSKQKRLSTAEKQEQNRTSRIRRVARLVNKYFRKGDLLVGYDYSDEGLVKIISTIPDLPADKDSEEYHRAVYDAADHQLTLNIDRLRRLCKAKGIELQYIAITSDMDGDTGEYVRVHHHLVLPAELAPYLRDKWQLGGVFISSLWEQADYLPLVEYLFRQVRHVRDAKSYKASRNLIPPEPRERKAVSGAELRVPKGAQLVYRSPYSPGAPQYIRYIFSDGADEPDAKDDSPPRARRKGGAKC